jgi:hypothetical protein
MVHDLSQDTAASNGQQTPRQAVAGLTPPQLAEAMIREVWPSVRGISSGIAGLSAALMRSVFLAPLGWALNLLLFGRKLAPVLCQRYTLTNRRLMVRRGWKPAPVQEIPLTDIDDVRLVADSYDVFYRSGDLQVLSGSKEALKLIAVPEPESFRQAIVNAVKSWGGPDKLKGPFIPASAPSPTSEAIKPAKAPPPRSEAIKPAQDQIKPGQ